MTRQDQLVVVDGTQVVLEQDHCGTLYRLAVRIDGTVTRPDPEQLGPGVNALYAQALAAVQADPTLGGLAIDVAEGGDDDEDAGGLEVDVAREAYAAPVAAMGLHLRVLYWVPTGSAGQREAILDAIMDRLDVPIDPPGPCVRERVLVALRGHLETALGSPITRNAVRPEQGAAVVLLDGDQRATRDTLASVHYATDIAVEVFQPAGSTTTLDTAVQAITGALRSAGRLGGLAIEVEEGTADPEVLRTAYSGACLAARIVGRIWFATAEGDPWTVAA